MSISANDVKTLREKTGAGMMDCKKALSECGGDFEQAVDFLKKQGLAKAEKKGDRVAAEGLIFFKADAGLLTLLELNCETDFVARNEDFQKFGQNLAELVHAKKPASVEAALELDWNGLKVSQVVAEAVAKIGEKINVRRFEYVTPKEGGKLGSYVHMAGRIVAVAEISGNVAEDLIRDICMQITAMNPQYVDKSQVPENVLEREKAIYVDQMKDSGKPANILDKIIAGKLDKFAQEISLNQQVFVKDPSGKKTIADYLKAADAQAKVVQFVRYAVGEGIEKRQDDFASEVAKMVS